MFKRSDTKEKNTVTEVLVTGQARSSEGHRAGKGAMAEPSTGHGLEKKGGRERRVGERGRLRSSKTGRERKKA